MNDLVIRLRWPGKLDPAAEAGLNYEWLVTNGLGGYASGTLSGVITRRYHGYLVAALPTPFGRILMLNELVERLQLPDGSFVQLAGEERADGPVKLDVMDYLAEFRLEAGTPIWRYEVGSLILEKRLVMPHGQNTAFLNYSLLSGDEGVRLVLRPSFHFRPHEDPVSAELDSSYTLTVGNDRYEISAGNERPPLRVILQRTECGPHCGPHSHRAGGLSHRREPRFIPGRGITICEQVTYRIEGNRGYPGRGDLWSPGFFHVDLRKDSGATLIASLPSIGRICARSTPSFSRRFRFVTEAPDVNGGR